MATTLKFIDAKQTVPGRDGMDVIYYYQVVGTEQMKAIHVVGSQNSWGMTQQDKYQYAQLLFTGIIDYIKRYWLKFGKLPNENNEVHDKIDFPFDPDQLTPWENYIIEL